jgi:hypothetical protein
MLDACRDYRAQLDAADDLASLIRCRVEDGKAANGGRHGMTPFCRDRMEALDAALAAYDAAKAPTQA